MSPQSKTNPDFATVSARRALTHLFDEFERARDERDEADARLARFAETIQLLLQGLPPADKTELSARFEEIKAGAPQSRGGEVFGNVIALFRDDRRPQWSLQEIQEELEKRGTSADSKVLSNTIAYLARTGRLRRVSRGNYVVVSEIGLGIEI